MRRILVAAALTALLTGCAGPPVPAAPVAPAPTSTAAEQPAAAGPRPVAVSIPSIGASSDLIVTGLRADGELEVPDVQTPLQASWWSGSPEPGQIGPAVILGHVDGGGQAGVFARLREVQRGAEIIVERADAAPARFMVYEVETVPKADFEMPASGATRRVFGDVVPPRPELRLITCGGDFDRATDSYEKQVVVYAYLAGP